MPLTAINQNLYYYRNSKVAKKQSHIGHGKKQKSRPYDLLFVVGDPYGNRTHVSSVRG